MKQNSTVFVQWSPLCEKMVFAVMYFFNKIHKLSAVGKQHLKRCVYQSIHLSQYFHMNAFEKASSSFAYHSISCQHSFFPPKLG